MIKLVDFPTTAPKGLTKKEGQKKLKKVQKRIGELHEVMMAEKKHSLLVVFQGMDSSGKDGATREAFKACSPHGVQAHSFKKPTEEEFAHDFLWRCNKLAPAKGHVRVFIRSHYEDILIQRVHKWIDKKKVENRIEAINAWEKLLQFDNNTTILKFYMHLSKDRQKEKLQERIDDPEKNWKHNPGDWEERKLWNEYMKCYEDILNRCNQPEWIIAPVDNRWYRNLFIAEKILETLKSFDMKLPTLPKED